MKNLILLLLFSLHIVGNAAVTVNGAAAGGTQNTLAGRNVSFAAPSDTNVLTWNATTSMWEAAAAAASGVTTMAAVGAVPNANGASISGTTLTLQPASITHPGVVSNTTQTFLGDKTISGKLVVSPGATDGYMSTIGTMYLSQFNAKSAYFGNGATFDGGGWHTYLSTAVAVIELGEDGFTRFFNNSGLGAPPSDFSPAARMYISDVGVVRMYAYGAGTATFDANGVISSVSDERLKSDIKPYESGLAQLRGIKPIRYHWNEKSGLDTVHEYAGFSAQNVKANIPEGTGQNSQGYLSLQDRAILATAVNAIKELEAQIAELKKNNPKGN